MTTKQDFPPGTIVHVKGHGNEQFIVDGWDFDEEENKEFCFADSESSFGFAFSLEDLELVMSVEDASKRTVPDASTIIGAINWLGSTWGDKFEIDGADSYEKDSMVLYAETTEGLKFSFVVRVTEIEPSFY